MKILVTDGVGYIGSVVVQKLLHQNYSVVVVDNFQEGHGKAILPQAIFVEGDLADKNLRSLQQLERGEREVKCPEFGNEAKMQLTDESRVNPQNRYVISKYYQKLIGLNLKKRYKIPTTCLRYSIVQGPRQSPYDLYSGALRAFALSVYFKRRPVIYEHGQ